MWFSVAMAVQPLGPTDVLPPDRGAVDREPIDLDLVLGGLASTEIVGGRVVEPGEYPDAVGIVFYQSYVGCTGTLVAPNVVITAGHCLDDVVTHVVVGASAWTDEGIEVVEVEQTWIHPSYRNAENGLDLGVIKLVQPSAHRHRIIADGCVLDAVTDGTPATMVGFGNTQTDGNGRTTIKHIAETLVVDADCSEDELNGYGSGCQSELRPGGEIVAGGRLDVDGDGADDGARDVCFGDSGGPLYVHTRYGTHVMGVVSRAMAGVERGYPCRDGSIWARPDAAMAWLEQTTGVDLESPNCNEPPTFEPEVIELRAGDTERFKPDVVDPDSDVYALSIAVQGTLGTAEVRGQRVFYTADPDAAGEDVIVVRVTDSGGLDGEAPASSEVEVPIAVIERGCGCRTAGASGWLGVVALALFGMRRR